MKVKSLTLLLSLCLIAFTACNSETQTDDSTAMYLSESSPEAVYGMEISSSEFEELTEVPTTQQTPPPSASDEVGSIRKLIKKGNLKFASDDFGKTMQSIKATTAALGGYLGSEKTLSDNNRTSTRITVRIPSEQFDAFLSTLSKDVKEFEERTISSQDVTEEFVDVNAQIAAKKKVEQRYVEILKTAKTVKEILEVEAQIGSVREEIDRAEGRLKYLKNQTSMSTLFIEFYKEINVTAEDDGSFTADVNEAFSNGLNLLRNLFLGIINIWPMMLLALGGYFIYRMSKKTTNTSETD